MRKIVSLFKRDYEGTRLVHDEAVPGAEWVLAGEGTATRKFDGTCCIPNPDFVAVGPRRVVEVAEDNSWTVLEPILVVSLDYQTPSSAPPER
jgi:hypothetical protein